LAVAGCGGGAKPAGKAAKSRPLAVETLEAHLSQNDKGSAADEGIVVGNFEDGREGLEQQKVGSTRMTRGERSRRARRETSRAKRTMKRRCRNVKM
jgi:hypothetical protein